MKQFLPGVPTKLGTTHRSISPWLWSKRTYTSMRCGQLHSFLRSEDLFIWRHIHHRWTVPSLWKWSERFTRRWERHHLHCSWIMLPTTSPMKSGTCLWNWTWLVSWTSHTLPSTMRSKDVSALWKPTSSPGVSTLWSTTVPMSYRTWYGSRSNSSLLKKSKDSFGIVRRSFLSTKTTQSWYPNQVLGFNNVMRETISNEDSLIGINFDHKCGQFMW